MRNVFNNRGLSLGLLIICLITFLSVQNVLAANNMPIDGCEVKFLLDSSKVLDDDADLKENYKNLFKISTKPIVITYLYLDTERKAFDAQGWINRLRIRDGKNGGTRYDITYRKRYEIHNNDVNAALTLANKDGFNSDNPKFKAEIDWSYNKMTLSVSAGKRYDVGTENVQIPLEEAKKMFLKDMPDTMNNWTGANWGINNINDSRGYGYVFLTRYDGYFGGTSVDVEILPLKTLNGISTEYVVEVSFDAKDLEEAGKNRDKMMEFLRKHNILVEDDGLKTRAILDRY